MTLHLTTSTQDRAQLEGPRLRGRAARRERRHLVRQDRLSAHLAELHHIQTLIADARTVVCGGWVQNGWFTYRDEEGVEYTATTQDLPLVEDRPVTGACLVGAIVAAGGGPQEARTQPVQRALDLTWHTLYGGHQRVHWCPSPQARTDHMCDLTRWNDQPGRTPQEVTALLHLVERAAAVEIERVRAL